MVNCGERSTKLKNEITVILDISRVVDHPSINYGLEATNWRKKRA